MRINKYWVLGADLMPLFPYVYRRATKKQYDSVSIYHEPRGKWFRPVVLRDKYIASGTEWKPKEFLKGLEKCLFAMDSGAYQKKERYPIRYLSHNTVRWGCRIFTRKQVNELIKLVKWHYDL